LFLDEVEGLARTMLSFANPVRSPAPAVDVVGTGEEALWAVGEHPYDAVVLDVMIPAPGQGALAVECRAADADRGGWLHDLLASIDDASTRAAVAAERTLLAELEAGCTAPVGAYATVDTAFDLHLVASVVSVDGVTAISGSASGPATDAEGIGRRLAAELFGKGAGALIGTRT